MKRLVLLLKRKQSFLSDYVFFPIWNIQCCPCQRATCTDGCVVRGNVLCISQSLDGGLCKQMKTKLNMCSPHSSRLQKAGTLIWVAEFLVNKGSKFMWSEVNSLEVNLKLLISKLLMFSTLNWLWAPCMKEKEKKFHSRGARSIVKEEYADSPISACVYCFMLGKSPLG